MNNKKNTGEPVDAKPAATGETTRSEARELLMQLLYQMSMRKDFSDDVKSRFISEYLDQGSSQMAYFEELNSKIVENLDSIDNLIENSSEHWKINRIDQIDLAILRLSIGEMLYVDSIPVSASINEAVELAKKYGGANSSKFINGILGNIARGNDGPGSKV